MSQASENVLGRCGGCGKENSKISMDPTSVSRCRKKRKSLKYYLMTKKQISTGVAHPVPTDLQVAIVSDAVARAAWEDITPLARNEWICWVTSVKKPETRKLHIERMVAELKEGMRRPCCWPGCPHRSK